MTSKVKQTTARFSSERHYHGKEWLWLEKWDNHFRWARSEEAKASVSTRSRLRGVHRSFPHLYTTSKDFINSIDFVISVQGMRANGRRIVQRTVKKTGTFYNFIKGSNEACCSRLPVETIALLRVPSRLETMECEIDASRIDEKNERRNVACRLWKTGIPRGLMNK